MDRSGCHAGAIAAHLSPIGRSLEYVRPVGVTVGRRGEVIATALRSEKARQ